MKKIAGIFLAAVISVLTAVSASAADKGASVSNLRSVTVETVLSSEVSVLNKSVSVSKTPEVSENGLLVIPSGRTLVLKNGAVIDGGLYIENGGTLTLSGGTLRINGAFVSDGKLTVKAGASVTVAGSLYTSPKGTFRVSGKSTVARETDTKGNIVCLGDTNSKSADIAKNPLAAVINLTNPFTGEILSTQAFTENLTDVIPDPTKYYSESEVPAGGCPPVLFMFFDNGACISASKIGNEVNGENYATICGVSVRTALQAADMAEPNRGGL